MAATRDVTQKQLEQAETALQVIYTWATYDHGRCLHPESTARLCRAALRGLGVQFPAEEKPATRRAAAIRKQRSEP